MYHFSDMPMEDSIEPSYDVVRDVIHGFGFQLEVINFIRGHWLLDNTKNLIEFYNLEYF